MRLAGTARRASAHTTRHGDALACVLFVPRLQGPDQRSSISAGNDLEAPARGYRRGALRHVAAALSGRRYTQRRAEPPGRSAPHRHGKGPVLLHQGHKRLSAGRHDWQVTTKNFEIDARCTRAATPRGPSARSSRFPRTASLRIVERNLIAFTSFMWSGTNLQLWHRRVIYLLRRAARTCALTDRCSRRWAPLMRRMLSEANIASWCSPARASPSYTPSRRRLRLSLALRSKSAAHTLAPKFLAWLCKLYNRCSQRRARRFTSGYLPSGAGRWLGHGFYHAVRS